MGKVSRSIINNGRRASKGLPKEGGAIAAASGVVACF